MLSATDPVQRVHLLSLNKATHYCNRTWGEKGKQKGGITICKMDLYHYSTKILFLQQSVRKKVYSAYVSDSLLL